jgi:uncharacterized protein YbjT (DUF2867 family)
VTNRTPATTDPSRLVLLTGATGYVGGRLLRALEARGQRLRCLARKPEHLASRVAPETDVVSGDAVLGVGLAAALRGVDTAFYLIHSMGAGEGFAERDRQAAANFGAAARAAGVKRIVYLGGLADERMELSPHLASRIEVGRVLRASGVPVVELRASIVIGSGSLSFEMIRSLVENLPVMVTPRWTSMRAQPIGIDDLVAYLLESLDVECSQSPIYEIGGADRVSYGGLMREYARQRGLRRLMLPVPVLTPRLSSLWLGLVTPLYARVGRQLVDGIRHETVVTSDAARRVFSVVPADTRSAIARALANEDRERAESRWSDASSAARANPAQAGGARPGRRLVDVREVHTPVGAAAAFEPIRRIGGEAGWYAHDSLWRLRGLLDLLVGGPGMRRGRRHPSELAVGDTLDCWRVTHFEPSRRLRLAAEMWLPGRAWLEFEVAPEAEGARIRQTAVFEPNGVAGRLYWYAIYPLHALVFAGMLRGIAKRALRASAGSEDEPKANRDNRTNRENRKESSDGSTWRAHAGAGARTRDPQTRSVAAAGKSEDVLPDGGRPLVRDVGLALLQRGQRARNLRGALGAVDLVGGRPAARG